MLTIDKTNSYLFTYGIPISIHIFGKFNIIEFMFPMIWYNGPNIYISLAKITDDNSLSFKRFTEEVIIYYI